MACDKRCKRKERKDKRRRDRRRRRGFLNAHCSLPRSGAVLLQEGGAHPFRPISLFSQRCRRPRSPPPPPPPRGTLQSRSLAAAAALSETCSGGGGGGGGSNGNEMVGGGRGGSGGGAAQISIYGIEDGRERGGCSFLSGNVHTQVLYLFPLARKGELGVSKRLLLLCFVILQAMIVIVRA